MSQNTFFPRTHDLLVSQKTNTKKKKSTLHPLSPVIFATATVVAFVLLRNSRFSFHCYTQCEATPTQKSARKWCCKLSQLFVRMIPKGIHSCKPALLNCPMQYKGCTDTDRCVSYNMQGADKLNGRSRIQMVFQPCKKLRECSPDL